MRSSVTCKMNNDDINMSIFQLQVFTWNPFRGQINLMKNLGLKSHDEAPKE